jgi:hypothetical protein
VHPLALRERQVGVEERDLRGRVVVENEDEAVGISCVVIGAIAASEAHALEFENEVMKVCHASKTEMPTEPTKS